MATRIPEPWELGDVLSEVSDLLEVGGVSVAIKRLSPLRPADMAAVVAELSEDHLRQLLERMANEVIADVLDYLDVDRGSRVFDSIPETRRPAVLDETSPEVATDLLHRIAWDDAAQTLVRMRNLNIIGDLLIHDDDDAGGLMSPTFAKLREYWTVRHALRVLRQMDLDPEILRELFAVDAQDTLVGRMELSELVFAPPNATIGEVMNRDVISVSATEDQESAVRLMQRYRLPSIPVTNVRRQLQGVITSNSLVEVAEQEATEDMFRLFGVGGSIATGYDVREAIRNRLPWLVLNLFTVMLAGYVLSLFQPTLNAMVLLAAFLPVVMGQAGIA
ncbi:MAG: magnesium transporter [Chloroflexi bacterium]|nr:magnesium transporter [Chloroflexota bacterium]